MHDGDLRGTVPQGPPDEPGQQGLDQEAARQDRKVMWPQEQGRQEHQSTVHVPQTGSLGRDVCSEDLRLKHVSDAREQNAKDKHVHKTRFNDAPKKKQNKLAHISPQRPSVYSANKPQPRLPGAQWKRQDPSVCALR